MLYFNKDIINKFKNTDDNTWYVVTDFDRTLTMGISKSSWGVLSSDTFGCNDYIKERDDLDNYYRPLEISDKLDDDEKAKYMEDWWNKNIELIIKYKLSEDVIKNAIKDVNIMKFRDGAISMLKSFHKRNIPVIIFSAGIGNFIELFLKLHGCYYENIYVISNFIKFENGLAIGLENNVIHSLNKNENLLPKDILKRINKRENILLMGDHSGDVKMVNDIKREKAFKIGFLEENVNGNMELYRNIFDLVCTDETSFSTINDVIGFLIK